MVKPSAKFDSFALDNSELMDVWRAMVAHLMQSKGMFIGCMVGDAPGERIYILGQVPSDEDGNRVAGARGTPVRASVSYASLVEFALAVPVGASDLAKDESINKYITWTIL